MRSFYAGLRIDPNAALVQAGITRWHRLEADPTALDLEPGLAARIADPLWMIGRQWQLGELRGEDAGTPILASLTGRSSRLALRGTDRAATDSADTIWEPFVEAEADPMSAYPALAAQAGLDFERALFDEGAADLIPALRSAYPFARPENEQEPIGREERLALALFRDAALDGARLLSELRALRGNQGTLAGLPAAIAVPAALALGTLRAATAWDEIFVQPADPAAWNDRRLEYHFDVDTDDPGGPSLHVEEYADGRLDWWSLRFGKPSPGPAVQPGQVTATRIPVPVRYAGMPANRYFELEDGDVNFAATSGGPTSIAGLLVLEYALAAGTDWFHLPLTLDYGQTFTVDTLTVRDTFGRPAKIERAGAGADGWCMFEVAMADSPETSGRTFVLPAVVAQTIEGAPIEEVAFFRDEMANLVWATERTVPGIVGGTRVRASGARVVHQELDVTGLADAAYLYRMQTPVPLDWHPMIATQDPDTPLGTVLFRRKLLRRTTLGADGAVAVIDAAPRGRILAGTDGVFQVEENEIPRSGVVVTRSFQMARTVDGRRLLWLGRSKRPGIGEGSSGLRFDVMTPVEPGGEPPVA